MPKRTALFPLGYDEVSLVDEGAGEEVDVLIMKRANPIVTKARKASSGGIPTPKKSGGKGRSQSNPCSTKSNRTGAKTGDSSQRASNWKEQRHKRNEDGQFDKTSSDSKSKYGKGGTTKSKMDAACRRRGRGKNQGTTHGPDSDFNGPGKNKEKEDDKVRTGGVKPPLPEPNEPGPPRRRRKQRKGAVGKSALSSWSSNDAHIRAIMERKPQ